MLKQFKKAVKRQYNDNLSYLSEKSVKLVLKKDLVRKAMQNKILIHDYFDYFSGNYLKTLYYLKDDFKEGYIYDVSGEDKEFKDNIESEIEDMEKLVKHLTKGVFKRKKLFRRVLNPLMFQNLVDKWKSLNDLFHCYPILLAQLRFKSNSNLYGDIDIEKELDKVNEAEVLKEDFYPIIKQIKNDKK